ncbi:ABC transporter permease (plasmid) [Hymenobacter monticola]|uniref:ABC transporter permease n=1 Tax=Hymenobacter monticola TaxID=1705399 RepID=A0ABY4BB89_9BACT|nr:ABC transporter permease [Hymenobacter monticola]UOE36423.1 ABC transporter permease [Hymenobacter monticola]
MLRTLRDFLLFLGNMVVRPERVRVLWHRTLEEIVLMGVESAFIVGLVALFIGAVTCLQVSYNLNIPFLPKSTIGFIVREMTLLELAPTVTSIVLAGKVGSNIAGSLGTMRITEQIDALEMMSINPTSYLVLPRILAAVVGFPLLVSLALGLALLGGYLAGTVSGQLSAHDYIEGLRYHFVPYEMAVALIKAVVFAFLIAAISAFRGFSTRGGALAVGASSTAAVTQSIIAILLADFGLARLLL